RLLRTRYERPRGRPEAERDQQFPPSDGDCHTPLPCEVRKWNDSTPRACSLAVQGGRMLVASTSVVASTALLPPPNLSECRHSALARCGIAVRRDVDLQGSLCEGLRLTCELFKVRRSLQRDGMVIPVRQTQLPVLEQLERFS